MGAAHNYDLLCDKLGVGGEAGFTERSAPCPLHSDRRPSFSINTETGYWICYRGCGQGEFTLLVSRVLGIHLWEAEKWIAENDTPVPASILKAQLEQRLRGTAPVVDTSSLTYFQSLDDKVMPRAFFDRGFTWETVRRYGLRWDTIRERLVIPFLSPDRKWLGYIARNFRPEATPKYINSIGLDLKNGLYLFTIPSPLTIIVVEGPLDALWLRQNRMGAIALCGTNLSNDQIGLLQQGQVRQIYLGLDNDEAGRLAMFGGTVNDVKHKGIAERLTRAGWSANTLRIVVWPKKDPNECSPDEIRLAVESAQSYERIKLNGRN